MERKDYCSMGKCDSDGLNIEADANPLSFSIDAFRASHSEWGRAEPRTRIKYPKSLHIDSYKMSDFMEEFSINRQKASKIRTLRDAIEEYVLNLNSTKHLFCMHSRLHPNFYYQKTILKIPSKLASMRKMKFPQVIIVTECKEASRRMVSSFVVERESMMRNKDCGIKNADEEVRSTESVMMDRVDRVMIGSYEAIEKYLDEVTNKGEIQNLAASVKFVVLNGLEKLSILSNYNDFIMSIVKNFNVSWTRLIFMYNFVNGNENLLDTIRFCRALNKEGMFVEVDRPTVRNLFETIQFQLISSPDDKATDLSLKENNTTGSLLSEENYKKARIYSHPQQQKMRNCIKLIRELRNEREKSNNRNKKNRRERILIVTANHKMARFLMLAFHELNASADENSRYMINTILEYDSEEDVELRNFEFRHGKLDVLVIDWKSIQSVIRGTVDSVIMYDRPHPMFFQTIMETEMENLTSRNCVKLKLFIFFNATEDLFLLPEYIKFLEKYNKKVPDWFQTHYKKFLIQWKFLQDLPTKATTR
uniref:ATP-dependent RNA helicase spindle-E n=1 Tax=Caenorhabditis tropicalis TaxID=1561998 RepID=A0A1I7U896_9PELO